jgi:predicted ArsR family transcriptional regulator
VKKNETTTIQIDKSVVESLKKIKEHPRQSYNELLIKLLRFVSESKNKKQYDKFLHKIQQKKMKELWDNNEDGVWDDI